jgi:hypothetical protein
MTSSHRSARTTVVAITLAVALALVSCGGTEKTATTTTPKPTTTTTVEPKAAITAVYEAFFNPAKTDEEKIALLEDPTTMRPLFERARTDPTTGPLLSQLGVRIDEIRVTSDTEADLDFAVLLKGKPATEGTFLGYAVKVDGRWAMSNKTVCALLGLADAYYKSQPACALE